MLDKIYLRNVPLPTGLTNDNIFSALEATQEFFKLIYTKTGINLTSIIQANTFSGVVSNVFTKKLSDISEYHSNSDQRYPDLKNETHNIGLEVKASNKPMKGGEGHNGHSGWHIVVCYKILDDGSIEFVQAEIANLIGFEDTKASDWKYQGSRRNSNDSQRTETYITTNIGTAKLRDGTVYLNSDNVKIAPNLLALRQKLSKLLPIPGYSPFNHI